MMSDTKMKAGKPETITCLNDPMISIEHSHNVIPLNSHLIRADKYMNTKFIHGAKKREVLLVIANDSGLASGRN